MINFVKPRSDDFHSRHLRIFEISAVHRWVYPQHMQYRVTDSICNGVSTKLTHSSKSSDRVFILGIFKRIMFVHTTLPPKSTSSFFVIYHQPTNHSIIIIIINNCRRPFDFWRWRIVIYQLRMLRQRSQIAFYWIHHSV